MIKNSFNQKGFTLLEIMIAMTVFAFFTTVYVISQGNNLADSANMRKEFELKNILESQINEIIINPPDYTPALLLSTENDYKTIEDFDQFEKRIQWFEFKLPDLSQLISGSASPSEGDNAQESIQSKIFENVSNNLQKMIWQLKVTVRNKETKETMEATTWLINNKAQIKLEGI